MPLLNASIGIKRMGELDYQLITASAGKKYPDAPEAVILAKVWDFISLAEEKMRDPNWYPFKMINVGGELKVSMLYRRLLISCKCYSSLVLVGKLAKYQIILFTDTRHFCYIFFVYLFARFLFVYLLT